LKRQPKADIEVITVTQGYEKTPIRKGSRQVESGSATQRFERIFGFRPRI